MTQSKAENRSPRYIRTVTFTSVTSDVKIGDGDFLAKNFSLQVKATGAVTSWSVSLEGSLDGVNFDQILTHTDLSPGDGKIRFDGTVASACPYFRVNCTALSLGAGTGIVCTALGL